MSDDLTRWKAFRALLENVTDPRKQCRLPTITDIERFESETGVKAPAGFRGFTQIFGPGYLYVGDAWIRCYSAYAPEKAPGGIHGEYDIRRGVLRMRESRAKSLWLYNHCPQILRLIPFASDLYGDQYCWDPEDVTDRDAPEFGIYVYLHDDDRYVLKLARTFGGFIRLYTNQDVFESRKAASVSDTDTVDPTFDFFKNEEGTSILAPDGQPLDRAFEQLTYEY